MTRALAEGGSTFSLIPALNIVTAVSSVMTTVRESSDVSLRTVLLPALNAMIDTASSREHAKRLHPPTAVFVRLGLFALIGSLFVGHAMALKPRGRLHAIGFAIVISISLFVILDYEFPRYGLIRVDGSDSVLTDVRRPMN